MFKLLRIIEDWEEYGEVILGKVDGADYVTDAIVAIDREAKILYTKTEEFTLGAEHVGP